MFAEDAAHVQGNRASYEDASWSRPNKMSQPRVHENESKFSKKRPLELKTPAIADAIALLRAGRVWLGCSINLHYFSLARRFASEQTQGGREGGLVWGHSGKDNEHIYRSNRGMRGGGGGA